MSNLYARDENIEPVHIRHYTARSRDSYVPVPVQLMPNDFVPHSEGKVPADVSYNELILTAAIDIEPSADVNEEDAPREGAEAG